MFSRAMRLGNETFESIFFKAEDAVHYSSILILNGGGDRWSFLLSPINISVTIVIFLLSVRLQMYICVINVTSNASS